MKVRKTIFWRSIALCVGAYLVISPVELGSQQNATVRIDSDDIGGVVTSAKGPEAGVWVIAETADLPTRFTRTVVTDDQGRYVIPDLPRANYSVWVRGYGLVDSKFEGGGGTERSGGGAILSRNLLVLHAQNS